LCERVPADLVLIVAARGGDAEPIGGTQRKYRQADRQEDEEEQDEGGSAPAQTPSPSVELADGTG
jgi:hypothetical protein